MSAFIVSKNHINTLVNYGYHNRLYRYISEDNILRFNDEPTKIGQILVDENYKSINYRYEEDEEHYKYKFNLSLKNYSPVQIIKACDCYDYQACETPDYDKSVAYKLIDTIRARAINSLDGYEKAEWEIR